LTNITTSPIANYGRIDVLDGASGQAANAGLVSAFTEITSAHDFAGLAGAVIWAIVAYNADSPTKTHVLRVSEADSFMTVLQRTMPNGETIGGVFVNVQLLMLNAAGILEMDPAWIMDTLE